MATVEQIAKLGNLWSMVIQQHMETVHETRLDYVPKGDPDAIETLLANWEQIDPPGYTAPTEQQLLDALALVEADIAASDTIELRQARAKTEFATLPNWANWTISELETYLDANISDANIDAITNLAEAKAMLKIMANIISLAAKAIFYLRNHTMPDLEGS